MKLLLAICFALLTSCSWNSPNVKVLPQVWHGEVLAIESARLVCVSVRYKEALRLRCEARP